MSKALNMILKGRREELNLSQKEVAKFVGVSEATVSRWETNSIKAIGSTRISKLLQILQLSPSVFDVDVNSILKDDMVKIELNKIPILGNVAGGEPIWANEEHEEYMLVENGAKIDFALRVKGDSMAPYIQNGDIVFIRKQPSVENGEVAVVLYGDSATLKRVFVSNNTLTLLPDNHHYQPMVFTGPEIAEVRILGKAIRYSRDIV